MFAGRELPGLGDKYRRRPPAPDEPANLSQTFKKSTGIQYENQERNVYERARDKNVRTR
jgi:hypothetical protein